jgi:branched-chain amino acid aminotransferase
VLAGITRDSILKIAGDMGIKTVEQDITSEEFYKSDEAFFTGTAAELTPIQEVDGHRIGEGKPGPITGKLQHIFLNSVHGKEPKYRKWLD